VTSCSGVDRNEEIVKDVAGCIAHPAIGSPVFRTRSSLPSTLCNAESLGTVIAMTEIRKTAVERSV
jgi:hypothetical protein